MHIVKESGTFTSKDGSKSTQLTAGDQIGEAEAYELGLISDADAKEAGVLIDTTAAGESPERKAQGAAPENKSKQG